jgi:glycosyltransferase involved in cell wall biosynthesis
VRILEVQQLGAGGGLTCCLSIAGRASEHGHDVTVAVPFGGRRITAPQGVNLVDLPSAHVRRAACLIRLTAAADAVHAHGTRAATWCLPHTRSTPWAVTYHGLPSLHRSASPGYRLAARMLLRTLTRSATFNVGVGYAEAATLVATGAPPERVRAIRNGTCPVAPVTAAERLRSREELGLAAEFVGVALPGALNEQKNPQAAAEIMRRLDDDFILLVAGDSPDMRRLANAWPPNLRIIGRSTQVPKLLRAADFFLTTSRWEGLPLAPLEAMAHGVPVVVSSAPGNVEVVGQAGFVFDLADLGAAAEAIRTLRDEEAMRASLGELGRKRIAAEFSLDRMLDEYLELYEELGR